MTEWRGKCNSILCATIYLNETQHEKGDVKNVMESIWIFLKKHNESVWGIILFVCQKTSATPLLMTLLRAIYKKRTQSGSLFAQNVLEIGHVASPLWGTIQSPVNCLKCNEGCFVLQWETMQWVSKKEFLVSSPKWIVVPFVFESTLFIWNRLTKKVSLIMKTSFLIDWF